MRSMTQGTDLSLGALTQHPFVEGHKLAQDIVQPFKYSDMVDFGRELLREHSPQPIDIIVGDDVSGRIPTLIAHRLLRLAQAGGHVDTVPRTFFMTSGIVSSDGRPNFQRTWDNNLHAHAKKMIGGLGVGKVVVITETIYSGKSVARLERAFRGNGVPVVRHMRASESLYLGGHGKNSEDRLVTGVEKYVPEPTSRRHPKFNGLKTAAARRFLDDYSKAMYATIFGEMPPLIPYYSAGVQPQARTKKFAGFGRPFQRLSLLGE